MLQRWMQPGGGKNSHLCHLSSAPWLGQGAGPVWHPQADMGPCPHLSPCPQQAALLAIWKQGENSGREGRCGGCPPCLRPLGPSCARLLSVSRTCQALPVSGSAFAQAVYSTSASLFPPSHHLMALLRKAFLPRGPT